MKIGINVSFLAKPMTGIGQVTKEFLKALSQEPHFAEHQWYFYTDGALAPTDKPLFHPTNCTWREVKTWWSRQDVPHQYLFEKFSLPREVEEDELDVFLSLYQSATIFLQSAIRNPQSKPIRHIMLVHDIIPKLFPEYQQKWTSGFHYQAVLKAIEQSTTILTPSLATKNDLIRELGLAAETIESIPLGVNTRFFDQLEEKTLRNRLKLYQLEPGYLYHGGGLEVRKNTEAVLRAYAKLVATRGEILPPLVISGKVHAESNPLATPVKRLIEELGLGDRVKLLGLVPEVDLPILYQGAKMFLFPSSYEGFGLPVLEAYASGTPVITTKAGALAELTSHDEALIVPVGDVARLAEVIEKILDDMTLAETLKTKGRVRAKEHTWESFARRVLDVLVQ